MAAAARGRLRVSHAERDRVIDTLKAAFVQGMLTKEELDTRAARAFASRTYADLAALTADIAAGLIQDRPPRQLPRPPEDKVVDSSQNKFVNRCARLIVAVIALDVAFHTGNLGLFIGVAVAMVGVLLVVEIRSRHQSAPSSSDSRP
jgi:Domain of unknown function (DUF1707)